MLKARALPKKEKVKRKGIEVCMLAKVISLEEQMKKTVDPAIVRTRGGREEECQTIRCCILYST